MEKILYLALALGLAAAPAARADFGPSTTNDGGYAFVLKHPVDGRTAFVRTTNAARVEELMTDEGFEVVAREGENGPEPVLAEVLPTDVVEASHDDLIETSAMEFEERDERSWRDHIDMGLGINLGLTTGGKIRVLGILDNGFMAGVDLDLGTVIFITDATVSGIVGWEFRAGRHALRPYLTLGYGEAAIFALFAAAEGKVFHGGLGFEWKPARWFGLGIEGGVNVVDITSSDSESVAIPYGRLNFMFYFL